MRIAYLTVKFPLGPTEAFFEPEVRSLAELVDEVVLIPIRPVDGASRFGDLGATTVYLPALGAATLQSALGQALSVPLFVVKMLMLLLFAPYRPVAKLKNLSLLPTAFAVAREVRRRGITHIHAQWLTTPATVAMIASRLTGVPWSASAHRQDIFAGNLIPQKIRSASFVRVISQRNRSFLIDRGGAQATAKTEVIYLGVELPANAAPRNDAIGRLRLICAAELLPVKGHGVLLRALRRVADCGIAVHCDLAGEGPLRTALLEQVAELGLEPHVSFRGYVAHDRLLAEIRRGDYDAAVLASIERPGTHEGIPVAMMEAMAAGVPCVSTASGSLSELIDPASGILVSQGDPDALADALIRLAGDPALRARLAEGGREKIRAAFETHATTLRLLERIRAAT